MALTDPARTEPIRSKKSHGNVLFMGGLVLIGLSIIGGYAMLISQSHDLQVQNTALLNQKKELAEALNNEKLARAAEKDALAKQLAALQEAADSAKLAKQAVQEATPADVTPQKSITTGKGWIYIGKFKDGKWQDTTLARADTEAPDMLANRTLPVADSVYIRDALPTADKNFALGAIVGIARRGQRVTLGQISVTKPDTYYAEVREVTGKPVGDKAIGYGFFIKSPGRGPVQAGSEANPVKQITLPDQQIKPDDKPIVPPDKQIAIDPQRRIPTTDPKLDPQRKIDPQKRAPG